MSEEIVGSLPAVPELVAGLPAVPELSARLPYIPELVLPAGTVPVMPVIRADVFAAATMLVVTAVQQQRRTVEAGAAVELSFSGRQVQSRTAVFRALAGVYVSSLIGAPQFDAVAELVFDAIEQQRRPAELAGVTAELSFVGREQQSRAVTFTLSADLFADALETQQRSVTFAAVADVTADALETQSRAVTFGAVADNTTTGSTGVEYSDDFNRTELGSLWYEHRYTGTTAPTITGNAVRAGTPSSTSGTNSQNQHALVYTESTMSDDMCAEAVTVTTPPAGYYMAVFARSDATADNMVIVLAAGTAATAGIYSVVDTTFTRQVDVPTNAFSAGDSVMLEADGNVYTLKRRRAGVVSTVTSWTDEEEIVNVGEGYRHGGIYVVSVRTWQSTTYGPSVDDFALYDL